jgi:hypothetical protein
MDAIRKIVERSVTFDDIKPIALGLIVAVGDGAKGNDIGHLMGLLAAKADAAEPTASNNELVEMLGAPRAAAPSRSRPRRHGNLRQGRRRSLFDG